MTLDELQDGVWAELSPRKHLAGRRRVARIVQRAMRQWPVAVLNQCDEEQAQIVGKHLARGLERDEHNEVGMGFLAALILGTLISEIVKLLLNRWLENRTGMMELCR